MDFLQRALYRTLRRAIFGFEKQGIPCTGLVGSSWPATLQPAHQLRTAFKTSPTTSTIAQELGHALSRLQSQKQLLQAAEPHTRWALSCWALHLRRCSAAVAVSRWGYADALEATSLLTAFLTSVPLAPLDQDELHEGLFNASVAEKDCSKSASIARAHVRGLFAWYEALLTQTVSARGVRVTLLGTQTRVQRARSQLDALAWQVAQTLPSGVDSLPSLGQPPRLLDPPPVETEELTHAHAAAAVAACWGAADTTGESPGPAPSPSEAGGMLTPSQQAAQFEALHQMFGCWSCAMVFGGKPRQALFVKGVANRWRLQQPPFEWVYDGLKPLSVTDVVTTGRGIALTLGCITVAVARRLGIQLHLAGGADGALGTGQGPVQVPTMPHAVAQRQAGRAALIQPELETCLAVWKPAAYPSSHSSKSSEGFQAGGMLLALDPVRPSALLDRAQCRSGYPAAKLDAAPHAAQVLSASAMHCRAAMTAYQRRGESDNVAHWLYQLLAVDPAAVEWGAALQQRL